MKYDFDSPVNRLNSNSLKWDVTEKELPMWVADMDFAAAPEIKADIIKRAEHGVFGYSIIPEEWHNAYINWWQQRHNFTIEKDWLLFCSGIVPAISSVVRKLTTPNENVLIQTPVYNIFFNSIINNGARVLENQLVYENKEYSINFADLEQKLAEPQTTLMILCNPHNPIGKLWNKETLAEIGRLCKKHHVVVLVDEIHCDLTDPDCEYTPFASISDDCRDNSITCISPTKAFNLAGLQTAAVMIPNPVLHHKVWRAINTDEIAEPNVFAVVGAISAFNKGENWLDELRQYIFKNKQIVADFVATNINSVKLVPSKATYLLWLDCSDLTFNTEELAEIIRRETGLWLTAGEEYGENGSAFLRMNIACPQSRLEDGLKRLQAGIAAYRKQKSDNKI